MQLSADERSGGSCARNRCGLAGGRFWVGELFVERGGWLKSWYVVLANNRVSRARASLLGRKEQSEKSSEKEKEQETTHAASFDFAHGNSAGGLHDFRRGKQASRLAMERDGHHGQGWKHSTHTPHTFLGFWQISMACFAASCLTTQSHTNHLAPPAPSPPPPPPPTATVFANYLLWLDRSHGTDCDRAPLAESAICAAPSSKSPLRRMYLHESKP